MAQTISIIDPVSRIEGHLRLKITISNGRVESAQAQGTLYRGFENLLAGRSPEDARTICQRICGVCPASHGVVSADAIERMKEVALPKNARILRNLLLGSEFLHSHILHFYHLCMPDYIQMPERSPWGVAYGGDRRLPPEEADVLYSHYLEAFRHRKNAHTIGSLVGGRMPHSIGIALGGMSSPLNLQGHAAIGNLLNELETFVRTRMFPDLGKIAARYPDYFFIGRGTGHFLCFGAFPDPSSGKDLFPQGFRSGLPSTHSPTVPLLMDKITESVAHSWYEDGGEQSPFRESTVPEREKVNGYSWIKAPRYMGKVCEVGPLARLAVLGLVNTNSSVMSRILARVVETALLIHSMKDWLGQYEFGAPFRVPVDLPDSGTAIGRGEAPRGSLAHYVIVNEKAIQKYQVVTPTSWNCSPRDAHDVPGVLEKASAGTPVKNEKEPIEVLRVLHSFDPCMACSVH